MDELYDILSDIEDLDNRIDYLTDLIKIDEIHKSKAEEDIKKYLFERINLYAKLDNITEKQGDK